MCPAGLVPRRPASPLRCQLKPNRRLRRERLNSASQPLASHETCLLTSIVCFSTTVVYSIRPLFKEGIALKESTQAGEQWRVAECAARSSTRATIELTLETRQAEGRGRCFLYSILSGSQDRASPRHTAHITRSASSRRNA